MNKTKSGLGQFLTRGTINAHCANCASIPYGGFSQIRSHMIKLLHIHARDPYVRQGFCGAHMHTQHVNLIAWPPTSPYSTLFDSNDNLCNLNGLFQLIRVHPCGGS